MNGHKPATLTVFCEELARAAGWSVLELMSAWSVIHGRYHGDAHPPVERTAELLRQAVEIAPLLSVHVETAAWQLRLEWERGAQSKHEDATGVDAGNDVAT